MGQEKKLISESMVEKIWKNRYKQDLPEIIEKNALVDFAEYILIIGIEVGRKDQILTRETKPAERS